MAWDRQEHSGWGVGLYPPGSECDGQSSAYASTEDGSAEALLPLVDQVLRFLPSARAERLAERVALSD